MQRNGFDPVPSKTALFFGEVGGLIGLALTIGVAIAGIMAVRNAQPHRDCERSGGTYQYHLIDDNECVPAHARR